MIVGIDYSMVSPAICCCHSEVFSYENCRFRFGTNKRWYEKNPIVSQSIEGVYHRKESDNIVRFSILARSALEFIDQCEMHPLSFTKPEFISIGIEGYAFGAKGQVFNIGENTGILKFMLTQSGYTYNIHAPSAIKKFATGKGNANKEAMYLAFLDETGDDLGMKFGVDTAKTLPSPITDIVDSYYIAKFQASFIASHK